MSPRKKRATTSKAKTAKSRKSAWQRVIIGILLLLDMLVVVSLLLTGYSGMVSPLAHGGVWGILPLGFGVSLLALVVLAVVHAFYLRRALFILLAGLLLCAGPFLTFCPLHIFDGKASADADTFTLLSYNVCNFDTADTTLTGDCPALDYILAQDADVVCLQEATFSPTERNRISKAQLDSLHARYPHVIVSGRAQALLSKFPVQPLHLDSGAEEFNNGDVGAYRLTMPSGRLMSIFNVHLYSYQLHDNDKDLYKNLTELKREPLEDVRSRLLHKLRVAAEGRARQTLQLQRWIRLYGGPECVVCGDFNDVPGCYAIRTLAESGFEDAYPRVGFGPMVTYHADRFYFCIDHVLTRGALRPLSLNKGSTKASDHYPITLTLELAE